jgi:hypothetical protein
VSTADITENNELPLPGFVELPADKPVVQKRKVRKQNGPLRLSDIKKIRPRKYSEVQARDIRQILINMRDLKIKAVLVKYQGTPNIRITTTANYHARPDCPDISVKVSVVLKPEHVSLRRLVSHLHVYASTTSNTDTPKLAPGYLSVDNACGLDVLNVRGKKVLEIARKQAASLQEQIDAEIEPIMRLFRLIAPRLTTGTAIPEDLYRLFDQVGPKVTGEPDWDALLK